MQSLSNAEFQALNNFRNLIIYEENNLGPTKILKK